VPPFRHEEQGAVLAGRNAAERQEYHLAIAKLWQSPVVTEATKAADACMDKWLAELNEFLARLNAKK